MSPMGNYNPYSDMESWYGVPDYGGNYGSYLGSQMQPLSLGRIVSMVRDLQNGQMGQPMINQGLTSMPTQAQIPAQIAASIMNTGNRLLSQPRQQLAQSGFNQMPEDPLQPNAPAVNRVSPGTSGGGGGGGFNIGNMGNLGMPSLPTSVGSAAGHINQPSGGGGVNTQPLNTQQYSPSGTVSLQPKPSTPYTGVNLNPYRDYFSGGGGGGLGGGGGGAR